MNNPMVRIGQYFAEDNENVLTLAEIRALRRYDRLGNPIG